MKNSSNFIPLKTISPYVTAIFNGNINIGILIKNFFGFYYVIAYGHLCSFMYFVQDVQ
ncbi:hypothetical protein J43TS3_20720 [Ornithinibacillus bavariensis]|uniref:Uncharacterized protein n=1 Tax=Ornithinibacillus bavariensis TaxID=545502 RepID=A0A920C624_9BACI|nr:hypothetical protein J43TS3_20720 [Ornithinibacillus bavariensis]